MKKGHDSKKAPKTKTKGNTSDSKNPTPGGSDQQGSSSSNQPIGVGQVNAHGDGDINISHSINKLLGSGDQKKNQTKGEKEDADVPIDPSGKMSPKGDSLKNLIKMDQKGSVLSFVASPEDKANELVDDDKRKKGKKPRV